MPHLGHKKDFRLHLPLHLHFAFVFAFLNRQITLQSGIQAINAAFRA